MEYNPDSDFKESFEEFELCKIHSNYDQNIYSSLSHIKIHYHLKLQIPMSHILYTNFCNDRRNLFQFACRQCYSYNNPQR